MKIPTRISIFISHVKISLSVFLFGCLMTPLLASIGNTGMAGYDIDINTIITCGTVHVVIFNLFVFTKISRKVMIHENVTQSKWLYFLTAALCLGLLAWVINYIVNPVV